MTRDEKGWCSSQLHDSVARKNITPIFVYYRKTVGRINYAPEASYNQTDILKDLDALITRPISRGSVEEIFFRMNLLHKLERLGMLIVNPPRAMEQAVDKYCSLSIFHENNIPVPKTAVTENHNEALKCFHELGEDIVVKPLFGSRGLGTTRITDPNVAERVFRTITFYHGVIYMQEFVPHGTTDLRVFVIGNKVVAAMRRTAKDWKTNFSLGAKPESIELSTELENLAIKAAQSLKCKVAGVDILEGPNGSVVLEVNSQPGWQGLQSVTKTNIADQIVNYVLSEVKK
jgi:RimK family alpha-L-glutamate ligase